MPADLRQAIESALSSSSGPTLGDSLAEGLSAALSDALANYPDLPQSWLVSAKILGLEMARALGLQGGDGTIDGRLHDEVRRIAGRHFQDRIDIGLLERLPSALRQPWQPTPQLLDQVARDFQLQDVQVVATLGGGLSGSVVLALIAKPSGGAESLLILKLTDEEQNADIELAGHSAALSSWLAPWTIDRPLSGELSDPPRKHFALLSRLALPPGGGSLYPESLHSVVVGGQVARSRLVAEGIAAAYCGHIISGSHARTEMLSPEALFARLRRHWSGLQAAWTSDDFWAWSGVPAPSVPTFLDGLSVRLNPLWYVCHGSSSAAATPEPVWMSFQHGDLNCRNILVEHATPGTAGSSNFRIIDYEKAGEMPATFDLCWLALWLIQAASGGLEPTLEEWEAAPDQLAASLLGRPRADRHLGRLQLAVDLVDQVALPLRSHVDSLNDPIAAGLFRHRIEKQMSLTLAACACAMCGYEVRKYVRLVRDGLDEEINDECRRALLWAWLYLRIGSSALRDIATPGSATAQARNATEAVRRLAAIRIAPR